MLWYKTQKHISSPQHENSEQAVRKAELQGRTRNQDEWTVKEGDSEYCKSQEFKARKMAMIWLVSISDVRGKWNLWRVDALAAAIARPWSEHSGRGQGWRGLAFPVPEPGLPLDGPCGFRFSCRLPAVPVPRPGGC